MSTSSLVIFGSTGFIGKSLLLDLEKNNDHILFAVNRYKKGLHGPKTEELSFQAFEIGAHLERYPNTTFINLTNAYSKAQKLSLEQLSANLFHPLKVASQLLDERQTFLQVGTYFEDLKMAEIPYSYAWSKREVSRMLTEPGSRNKFKNTIIKLFDVYGEGDDRPKLMNLLVSHFKNGDPKSLEISCPNKQIFPVHVQDAVEAIKCSMERPGSISFAAPKQKLTLEELVSEFRKVSKREGNINWHCDGDKMCGTDQIFDDRFVGSKTKIPIREGIARMLRD